ncbi:hypothetical protein [Halobacteriovorax sp.]|uniref:hypothetical protein n=1 Tax=Halobacteriovorax sp. TaxID=2020862 RepID=UPI0035629D26
MKKNLLILTLLSLFSTVSFAENIQVKSLNQGTCWIKEEAESVKATSFVQGISVELNNYTLSKISELNLPTKFESSLDAMAFCSGHGLSLVLNAAEKSLRYCVWLKINQDGFETQSVGLTDIEGKCDGYRPGVIILSIVENSLDREQFLKDLKNHSLDIEFKSFEEVSEGLVKIELLEENWGSEAELSSKFQKLEAVKYAEKSFFYHPIGEWSDLEVLGRE